MKTGFSLGLLFCLPQISFAQVGPISPPMCELINKKRIVAEVVDVERHPEGDPKYSVLNIVSIFQIDQFRNTLSPKVIKARHAHRDFELFEGEHVLTIQRTHCRAEWYIERSSHGEIVDAAERQRRKDVQVWKDHNSVDSVEPKLCYIKIKRAYDLEIFTKKFELEDTETCRKYLVEYNEMYLRVP